MDMTNLNGYLVPKMAMKETHRPPVGRIGLQREKFLQENHSLLYDKMLLDGAVPAGVPAGAGVASAKVKPAGGVRAIAAEFNGERLVVNKFIYRFQQPTKGEVIVFRYPRDPSRDFIKRVIAVPGDTIEIKDGRVFVNQKLMNEPYILEKTLSDYPQATVPEGHVFVMGDNRNNSEDSRFADVGFVPYDLIKGKAVLVFWPVDQLKTLS